MVVTMILQILTSCADITNHHIVLTTTLKYSKDNTKHHCDFLEM